MKIAMIVKDNELSDYPGDLYVDGEVRKSLNLEFEMQMIKPDYLVAKSLPAPLIKKLRDLGVVFVKLNSIDELEELNLVDAKFLAEFKNKRGWKCGKKGF